MLQPLPSNTLDRDRKKIRQIFEYLKALNEHRNPPIRQIGDQPWSLRLGDLPDHPSIQLGEVTSDLDRRDVGPRVETEAADTRHALLSVTRPALTSAPAPPAEIREWLRSGWQNPANDVEWRETRNQSDDGHGTHVLRFDDDATRPVLLERWIETREQWRLNELPARRAMRVFEQLYELHGRIERESERVELVLGDGILSWAVEGGSLFHPIVLQRAQLVFDPSAPRFDVVDTDQGPELYTALFQSIPGITPQAIARCKDELEQQGLHPLAAETSGFLRGFAGVLSPHSEFVQNSVVPRDSETPMIGRSPVLFLRRRILGYSSAIEAVLERLDREEEICTGLWNVVGIDTSSEQTEDPDQPQPELHEYLPTGGILFGKEANPEQVRIARRLKRHGSVLVQGPPGTGKSHTIANLIGHLLAQGQTVLVTSHTTKALRVLRSHIVAELQPLCVSVLDSDLDSREELRQAVEGISRRVSESDAEALRHDAAQLTEFRQQLLDQLHRLHDDLLNARSDEYRDVVIAGAAWAPSVAARRVAEGPGMHDWIPGPVQLGEPLPLSTGELIELYATNRLTEPEDDRAVDEPLPDVSALMEPDELDQIVAERQDLSEVENRADEFWQANKFTLKQLSRLESLYDDFRRLAEEVHSLRDWELAAVAAGFNGDAERRVWQELLRRIAELRSDADEFRLTLVQSQPQIDSELTLDDQLRVLSGICEHLKNQGTLSGWRLLLRPSWNRLVRSARVGGQRPKTAEHFRALHALSSLRAARHELARIWDAVGAANGLPRSGELGDNLEQPCSLYVGRIEECLSFCGNRLQPLIAELREFGFHWDGFLNRQPPNHERFGELLRIVDAVAPLQGQLVSRSRRLRAAYLRKKLQESAEYLQRFDTRYTSPLLCALQQTDLIAYREAYTALLQFVNRRDNILRRRELLGCLERLAEAWAASIRNRVGVHSADSIPGAGDAVAAWEWRQLHDELERRAATDLETFGQQIESLQHQIRDCTVQLIDRLAWARQVKRIGIDQHSGAGRLAQNSEEQNPRRLWQVRRRVSH